MCLAVKNPASFTNPSPLPAGLPQPTERLHATQTQIDIQVGERAFVYREPGDDAWKWAGTWDKCRLTAMFPKDADIDAAVAVRISHLPHLLPCPVHCGEAMNQLTTLSSRTNPMSPEVVLYCSDPPVFTTHAGWGRVVGCRRHRWAVASAAVSSDGGMPAALPHHTTLCSLD
jgi:hypothetical protein